jgi:hypothetical protein
VSVRKFKIVREEGEGGEGRKRAREWKVRRQGRKGDLCDGVVGAAPTNMETQADIKIFMKILDAT